MVDLSQEITSPYKEALLQALEYQGATNNCGPFSATTVINGVRGLHLDPAAIAAEMNQPVWRGWQPVIRRFPNGATLPWGMVDILKTYQFSARWTFLYSRERLMEDLAAGALLLPIIASWSPLWAHIMTLIAWHPENGWGFANTQYPQKVIFWLADSIFKDQWKATAHLIVIAHET